MEYTSGAASWQKAMRRAVVAFLPRRPRQRRPGWSIGVPLIAAAAGLLFTTTATTAGGTALREDRRPQLTQLIEDRREQVAASELRAARLRADVESDTAALADTDVPIKEQRDRARGLQQAAGFTALTGSGLTVELNDAPRRGDGTMPKGATNDDLVVHQGDVQAVVNALWAGGAEAMSIMNVRVLSTSAVRCVGNTLLLHGRVYSPPFKIVAIGDPAALQQALAGSQGVGLFKQAVDHYQLGYSEHVGTVSVPAFEDSTALRSATVPR
ncbi:MULTISPECIES: DUF881 domain-containing protein [Micromonospora]|uniref:Uncharacterized conserved protein YlxW, UPF0749 family n=1 Tax=Micromonospora rifamycinica TaxID=291594 RepID=A0A109IPY4_9ACTN|nr:MULTISPECIES: DUF881 domain-containing protein [Micromonospora]KWV34510.1 hypothetical protein AWV63_00995 [Micromonospora rifamycinica]WFE63209.1 DUF881 domain-containing protein [Micromonospora sp. WMMD714]SCG72150.1 Uncharacterized conserved protein YlxW, UPF0749 family [Micromonospora rifamycinica]